MKTLSPEDLRRLRLRTVKKPPKRLVAPKESQGLGDTIAKVIHVGTLGIVKPCGGCRKRQRNLNERYPYKNRGQKRTAKST